MNNSFRDNVLMTGVFASFEPVIEFESARSVSPYEDGKVYQIEIERKLGNKLTVLCSISPNYPIDPPRLSLTDSASMTAATSSQLQYLEEHVWYKIHFYFGINFNGCLGELCVAMSSSRQWPARNFIAPNRDTVDAARLGKSAHTKPISWNTTTLTLLCYSNNYSFSWKKFNSITYRRFHLHF